MARPEAARTAWRDGKAVSRTAWRDGKAVSSAGLASSRRARDEAFFAAPAVARQGTRRTPRLNAGYSGSVH